MKPFHSIRTALGTIIHYNDRGEKIGESREGFLSDSLRHYDASGNYIGRTDPGFLPNSFVTRDSDDEKLFSSSESINGSFVHRDDNIEIGRTNTSLLGTSTDFSDSSDDFDAFNSSDSFDDFSDF